MMALDVERVMRSTVITIHPVSDMNVCIQFHGNPFWDIVIKTTNVIVMVVLERAKGSPRSLGRAS